MTFKPGQLSKYKEEYCGLLIEIMKEGYSCVEFCSRIDIHIDTFYEWLKVHPAFSESYAQARIHAAAFLEDKGLKNLNSEHFQTGLYCMLMRNRCNWDKQKQRAIGLPNFCGSIENKLKAAAEALAKEHISLDEYETILISVARESQIKIETVIYPRLQLSDLEGQYKRKEVSESEYKAKRDLLLAQIKATGDD